MAISLLGLKLPWSSIAFIGWFGPRGLATLLFALLVVKEFSVPNFQLILTIAVVTVLLSMIAHGISARPGSDLYGRSLGTESKQGLK